MSPRCISCESNIMSKCVFVCATIPSMLCAKESLFKPPCFGQRYPQRVLLVETYKMSP